MSLNQENQRIYNETAKLLMEARRYAPTMKNPVHLCKKMAPKYPWLKENFFAIFRMTCYGQMQLNTLMIMLQQKQLMDDKKASIEEASFVVRDVLCEKYNIDQVKMAKTLAKEQAKEEKKQ